MAAEGNQPEVVPDPNIFMHSGLKLSVGKPPWSSVAWYVFGQLHTERHAFGTPATVDGDDDDVDPANA